MSPGEGAENRETIPGFGGDAVQHTYRGNSMKVLQELKTDPPYNLHSILLDIYLISRGYEACLSEKHPT